MKKILSYILFSVCILLVILDFLVDKSSIHFKLEKSFLFFALAGFISTFFYIFISNIIRRFLLKDNDFYDKQ